MKKKFLLVIVFLFMLSVVAACKKDAEKKIEFTWPAVKETATAEISTYYEFEQPDVKCGDKKATVSVKVTYDNQDVIHNGAKVFLAKSGIYEIIYVAEFEKQSETRKTVLTVGDTTEPSITANFPFGIFYGEQIALADYCNVRDASDISSVVYKVVNADTAAQITSPQFDSVTNVLNVSDEAIKNVKVEITATDAFDNSATVTSDTITLLSRDPMGTVSSGNIYAFGSQEDRELVNDDDKGEVTKWNAEIPKNTMYTYWVNDSRFADFAKYDFIDIVIRAEIDEGSSRNAILYLGEREYIQTVENRVQGVQNLPSWTTVSYEKSGVHGIAAFESFAVGRVGFSIKNNSVDLDFTGKIYVESISGRYADVKSDGSAIDLTQTYQGITDAWFEAMGSSDSIKIDDLTKWTPFDYGTLIFDAVIAGYNKNTFEVGVSVVLPDEVGNVSAKNIFAYGAPQTGSKELVNDPEKGVVVKWDFDLTAQGTWTYWVNDARFADFADYDFVDIWVKVESVGSKNAFIYLGDQLWTQWDTGAPTGIANQETWTKLTFVNKGVKGEAAFDGFASGRVGFNITANAAGVKSSIYVASISGRYDNISSDGSAIDLIQKYGGVASATFNGQPVSDLTAFIPDSEGTLELKVERSGYKQGSFTVNVAMLDAVGTVSVKNIHTFGSPSNGKAELAEDSDKGTVVKWDVNLSGGTWTYWVNGDKYADFADYDFVDIWVKIVNRGGTNAFLYLGGSQYTQYDTGAAPSGIGNQTSWTKLSFRNGGAMGAAAFGSFKSGRVGFNITCNGGNVDSTIYVAGISGKYADIASDGSAIDLTQKFGGIVSATFNGQPVSDLTAFTPDSGGTLEFEIKRDGYKQGSFSVNVKMHDDLNVWSVSAKEIHDLGNSQNLENNSTGTKSLAQDETKGEVFKWDINLPSGAFFGYFAKDISMSYFGGCDFVDIDAKISITSGGNSLFYLGIRQYSETPSGLQSISGLSSWKVVSFANSTKGGNNQAFEDFTKNSRVGFSVKNNNNAALVATVCISSITGRYGDITRSGAAINLTSKFAGIQSAKFNSQSITDFKTFNPSEDGTLEVTTLCGYSKRTFTLNVISA